MGRKIPGRKHRGIRDPEKQAAIRFESIKNKINAPPSNTENQEIPKSLQRVIELKDKVKSGDFFKKKKKLKNEDKTENSFTRSGKPERPAREFHQLPSESDRQFVHRMNRICTDVVKEAEFEEKYGVEIKRNVDGEIEGVVKRQKDELELLVKKAKKKNMEQKGNKKKKKKKKDKQDEPRLSKWQKRKKKLVDKKDRKEIENIDEFKKYKDEVKFGEIAHAPPSLVAPRRVEKHQTVARPGKKNLLLKTMIGDINEKKSVSLINMKNNLNKTSKKTIDKKGKRKELPNSLRRQLDQQQKEIINAYKELKAKRYK